MAIEIGQKSVKDTETYNDYAIGLSLPLNFDNSTFAQTYETTEQVKSNIRNLLLTRKGERIMQPEFGCPLTELVFENITDELETKIEDAITDSIDMWLPYISVEDIIIDISDELRDKNTVKVSLTFRIGENVDLNELTFTIE